MTKDSSKGAYLIPPHIQSSINSKMMVCPYIHLFLVCYLLKPKAPSINKNQHELSVSNKFQVSINGIIIHTCGNSKYCSSD